MRSLIVAALALVAACSYPAPRQTAVAAEARAVHPVSGLPIIPLTVTTSAGVRTFRVEVASTEEQQARGLMFRTSMGADEGMVFPMERPRLASFWMRNTVIPLDIIFVGTDGRVLNIAANTVPYSERSLLSFGPVKAVLELNGGRAAALGIAPGDPVAW